MITTFSDEAIIKAIGAGGQQRQKAIAFIYRDKNDHEAAVNGQIGLKIELQAL